MVVVVEDPLVRVHALLLDGDPVVLVLHFPVGNVEHLACVVCERVTDAVIAVAAVDVVDDDRAVDDGHVGRLHQVPVLLDCHRQLNLPVLAGKQVVRVQVRAVRAEHDGGRTAGLRERHALRPGCHREQAFRASFLHPVNHVAHAGEHVFLGTFRLQSASGYIGTTALASNLEYALQAWHRFHEHLTAVVGLVHVH